MSPYEPDVLPETIQGIADVIAAHVTNADGDPLNVHAVAPGLQGLGNLPALTLGLPTVDRNDIEESDRQLGSDSWDVEVPVAFYLSLTRDDAVGWEYMSLVEQLIKTLDDPAVWGDVPRIFEARLTRIRPMEVENDAGNAVALLAGVGTIKALLFVEQA